MLPAETFRQVQRIHIRTRRLVDGALAGEYHSVFKGRGMEFAEVREYVPGDDVRTIDWNVTARMGQPFVKQYVEERELTVMLLVDLSGSAQFGSVTRFKSEIATELCALLALSAIRNNDKVGLILFTDRVEHFIAPQKGRNRALQVIRDMLVFEPAGRGTDVGRALEYLHKVCRRRSVTFLISDFLARDYEGPLRLVHQRHDLVPICITDPREMALPDLGLIMLRDLETGEHALIDSGSAAVRRAYREQREAAAAARRRLFRSHRRRPDRGRHPRILHAASDAVLPAAGETPPRGTLGLSAMTQPLARRGAHWLGDATLVPLRVLFLVMAAGWIAGAAAQTGAGDGPAVRQEHSIEGVRLALEVDRQELAIDGRIRVIMQLDVAPGRVAALPDLPDRVGRFAVAAQSPAESSSEGGALVLRRHYDLEPESVGALTVPPFVIAVRDRQGGDDTVQEIRTDPVPITVTSVVPDGVDYTEPKDIAPPMSLPPPAWPIALWALLGAVAAAIAAGVVWWRRRRRPAVAARPQPAHLLALAELDRLQQAEFRDADRFEAFYVRLSAILRRYLGWRFGLRALMQTTEEFVAGLSGAERALTPYRGVLGTLLAGFDLVKFARHRPQRSDMEEALRRVREFVERTADEQVLVDPAAAHRP